MVQPSELDTLVALRILIDILRSEGEFVPPGEKTRQPVNKPARP
jgi:hypothetical protein